MTDPTYSYAIARHRLSKAEDTRQSMIANYSNGRYDDATDDAYYSIFQLLLGIMSVDGNDKVYSRHSQLIGGFNRKYIYEMGLFQDKFTRKVDFLFNSRQGATCKNNVKMTEEDFEKILSIQKSLYSELRDYLEERMLEVRKTF